MIWTLLLLTAAVLCYTISQLAMHSKLRWQKNEYGFWGELSYFRKYKFSEDKDNQAYYIVPNNWYYRFFKIKYKERFPLSATLLVFLTDGYHLSQMFFKLFLALSFVPLTGWIWAGVIWVTFGISFTIFYKIFSR